MKQEKTKSFLFHVELLGLLFYIAIYIKRFFHKLNYK